MDYDAQALEAQIQALLKQNEVTLAGLTELQDFSVNKTLQDKGIDPAEFDAWIRNQVPPKKLEEIDAKVAREIEAMKQDLVLFNTANAPAAKPVRRRNMV